MPGDPTRSLAYQKRHLTICDLSAQVRIVRSQSRFHIVGGQAEWNAPSSRSADALRWRSAASAGSGDADAP
jgi:hypothetical protein